MNKAYLLTGSNIGDRLDQLRKASELINNLAGKITVASQIYETEPWGFEDSVFFLNQVVLIETELDVEKLLECIQYIERKLGRIRKEGIVTSRNIDIDILFYNSEILNEKNIIVPHPKLHLRKFTLLPLMDIAPSLIHPILNKDIRTLSLECTDDCEVSPCKINALI